MPGGRLHHDGAGGYGPASGDVGAASIASKGRAVLMSRLIRNGTVVNAESSTAADVLVDGEKIKEVRKGIPVNAAEHVLDATGLLVMPGGIDAHTHLDMPFGGATSRD